MRGEACFRLPERLFRARALPIVDNCAVVTLRIPICLGMLFGCKGVLSDHHLIISHRHWKNVNVKYMPMSTMRSLVV